MSGNFRKSDGGGLIGSRHRDPALLMARRLSKKDWEKPKDIQHARHLAHDGYTACQIAMALGWDIWPTNVWLRLKKYNIRPRNFSDRAHDGELTGMSSNTGGKFSTLSYKPRQIGNAA